MNVLVLPCRAVVRTESEIDKQHVEPDLQEPVIESWDLDKAPKS